MSNINVVKFIKDYLANLFIDLVSGEYLLKITGSIIDKIPVTEIRSALRAINDKIDAANNLYRGLLTLALQKALSFLDNTDLNSNLSPYVYINVPLIPA